MADDDADVGEQINDCVFWRFSRIYSFLQDKDLHFVEIKTKGTLISWWILAKKLILESQAGLKKRKKYLHSNSQNENLKLMTFTMLGDIAKNINDDVFFSIMAGEATESSNNEQLVVCIRWLDNNFDAHEDFIGIHAVKNIKSDTFGTVLKDILIWLIFPLSNCRSQCHDGASNVTGLKRGVATQIESESALAFLTHCYDHALNLTVNNMIKEDDKQIVKTYQNVAKKEKECFKRF